MFWRVPRLWYNSGRVNTQRKNAMFSLISQVIRLRDIRIGLWIFSGLFGLSLGLFVLADDQTTNGKNIFQDTDQDGLSNEEERLYKTDAMKADSDGDGYSDGAEVKSGYDPTVPAPGDRMASDDAAKNSPSLNGKDSPASSLAEQGSDGENLTQELSAQMGALLKGTGEDQPSLEDIRSAIQETLDKKIVPEQLPDVDISKIKVKKQKYDKFSKEERETRIKEDALQYVTTTGYILMNNSPTPIRSEQDAQSLLSLLSTQMTSVISTQDSSSMDDLAQKGSQMMGQLQSVEVPESMLDTHVKALRMAQYAMSLKSDIKPRPNDPLGSIAALSKMQGLMGMVQDFTLELQQTLEKNGVGVENIPLSL